MQTQPVNSRQARAIQKNLAINPQRLALVSRTVKKRPDLDFEPDTLNRIADALREEKVDTVVFSLWSIYANASGSRAAKLFAHVPSLQTILWEVCNGTQEWVEVLGRGAGKKAVLQQRFGKGTQHKEKQVLADELDTRVFGRCFLLVCGETNILTVDHSNSKKMRDPFNIQDFLNKKKIEFVLNPGHDGMVRYEMSLKRKYLSRGRQLVSVWNRNASKKNQPKQNFIHLADGKVQPPVRTVDIDSPNDVEMVLVDVS